MKAHFIFLLLLTFVLTLFLPHPTLHAEQSPIHITCDADLQVFPGSGTPNDPYRIEDLQINASSQHGIWIENTRAWVLINNCTLLCGRSEGFNGILLRNVSNVIIRNCSFMNNFAAVWIECSSNVTIDQVTTDVPDTSLRSFYCFFLMDATNITIINSSLTGNQVAGWIKGSQYIVVTNNTLYGARRRSVLYWAIYTTNGSHICLEGNSGSCDGHGIGIAYCYNVTLAENSLSGDPNYRTYGLLLQSVENCTLRDNNLTDFFWGMSIYGSDDASTLLPVIEGTNVVNGQLVKSFISVSQIEVSGSYALLLLRNCSHVNITITQEHGAGIIVYNCTACRIASSTLRYVEHGVRILCCSNITVKDIAIKETWYGALVYNSSYLHFTNVSISCSELVSRNHPSKGRGVLIANSSHILLTNLRMFKAGLYGLQLTNCSDALAESIEVFNSTFGIMLSSTNCVNLTHSVIANNTYGAWVENCDPTYIYDNKFLDNDVHAVARANTDTYWNVDHVPGTNIVGGPLLGGNFWDNYTGTDADGDGFGDTPYVGDGFTDYLPLVPSTLYLYVTRPSPNGMYINKTTVTIEWVGGGADLQFYTARVFNESWSSTPYQGSETSYTVSNLSEGNYSVLVTANGTSFDRVNRRWFVVDLTPPEVLFTGASRGSNSLTVYWTGSDEWGIDHYEVRLYNATWDSGWIDTGTDTQYTFYGISSGDYNLTIKAVDYAGNSATTFVKLTVTDNDVLYSELLSSLLAILLILLVFLLVARRQPLA